jgi:hypothetical protein
MSHDICSHIAPSRGSKAPTGSPVTDPGQIYPAVDEAIGATRYPDTCMSSVGLTLLTR